MWGLSDPGQLSISVLIFEMGLGGSSLSGCEMPAGEQQATKHPERHVGVHPGAVGSRNITARPPPGRELGRQG